MARRRAGVAADFADGHGRRYFHGCAADGKLTVNLQFSKPMPLLPAIMALPYFAIAAPDSLGGKVPVGTGPFRWRGRNSSTITLANNPLSSVQPAVATISFVLVSGTAQDAAGTLRTGAIDIFGTVKNMGNAVSTTGLRVVNRQPNNLVMIGMNQATRRPLASGDLRAAVRLALDPPR